MQRFRVCRRTLGALLGTVAATALVLTSPMSAQGPARSQQMDALARLEWREVGPANQAGRVSVFVGVPGDPN
ncbi:MAG: hypothetical protein OEW19_18155, partial [Acidobacteriota bacterium]|nr:hypothetical protein [Acidobacteriota bacterium]